LGVVTDHGDILRALGEAREDVGLKCVGVLVLVD